MVRPLVPVIPMGEAGAAWPSRSADMVRSSASVATAVYMLRRLACAEVRAAPTATPSSARSPTERITMATSTSRSEKPASAGGRSLRRVTGNPSDQGDGEVLGAVSAGDADAGGAVRLQDPARVEGHARHVGVAGHGGAGKAVRELHRAQRAEQAPVD